MPAFTRRLIALLVLELDQAISAYRTGRHCGLPALAITRLDGNVQTAVARGRRLPSKPDGVELAVLTALADVYGPALFTSVPLGRALRLIADCGGVGLVQCVLWGETASDGRLAILLDGVYERFAQLASVWPEAFLTEANSELARFRGRPAGIS